MVIRNLLNIFGIGDGPVIVGERPVIVSKESVIITNSDVREFLNRYCIRPENLGLPLHVEKTIGDRLYTGMLDLTVEHTQDGSVVLSGKYTASANYHGTNPDTGKDESGNVMEQKIAPVYGREKLPDAA